MRERDCFDELLKNQKKKGRKKRKKKKKKKNLSGTNTFWEILFLGAFCSEVCVAQQFYKQVRERKIFFLKILSLFYG